MKKLDFNRDWTVQKEGSPEVRAVNLPDDAMIRECRRDDAPSGSAGAFFEGGKYTYTKTWNVTENAKDQNYILEFEGIYQNAEVYLNGEKLAYRPYGYSNFFVDLTNKLQSGVNEIKVIADNSEVPNSRWYSGSGIYRPVWLYEAGKEYIRPEGIRITTESENTVHAVVNAVCDDSEVMVRILDQNGTEITTVKGDDVYAVIPDAVNWSDENPYLYTCRVELVNGEDVMDSSEMKFGVRTLEFGEQGMLVNGKPVKLRGACVHHDNGILGACSFRDAEYRRIRILKEAGFNAIRSSHNPASKYMLEACDELGVYVMDELYDMWLVHKNRYDFGREKFNEWWKTDLKSMVDKDYSHPSVIMYSLGNEISELGREDGQAMAKEMTEYLHSLDSSRPATAGINLALAQMASMGGKKKDDEQTIMTNDDTKNAPTSEFFNKLMNVLGEKMDKAASTKKADAAAEKLGKIFDVNGYNYATSRYEKDAVTGKPFVGSETMPHKLYVNWQYVKKIPTLLGDFMWTGWDYLGEAGIGTIRYMDRKTKKDIDPGLLITSGAGVIDICGKKRPESYWNQMIWGLRTDPIIGVNPYTHADHFMSKRMWRKADTIESWSWQGCEGKKADVYVYSPSYMVELKLNGKSLGKKKTDQYTAVFKKAAYQKGTLEAYALDESGNVTGTFTLTSADEDMKISVQTEKTELVNDGQSLAYLDITLTDQNGVVISSKDRQLHVEVSGAGTLAALGSARPNMAEEFTNTKHQTYYGHLQAVVRSGYEAGTITVRVSGEGVDTEEITIEVKEK